MSVHHTTWVWGHSKAKGSARLVLLALADWANGNNETWYRMNFLARKCNIDVRNVRKHVSALVKLGELKRDWRAGMALGNNSNLFTILCPKEDDKHPAAASPSPVKKTRVRERWEIKQEMEFIDERMEKIRVSAGKIKSHSAGGWVWPKEILNNPRKKTLIEETKAALDHWREEKKELQAEFDAPAERHE